MEKLGINFKNLDATALINVKRDQSTEIMSYKDLLKESMKVSLVIEEFEVPKESTIGILDRKSFSLMAITLGILEADFSFCYVNEEDLRIDLIDYNARFVFSESKQTDLKLLKHLRIFGKEIYFYQFDIVRNLTKFNETDNSMLNICYAIKTSGTSGKKKTVHVTYSAILPNITSLQRTFQLNKSDVILSVSPISFDPFIVDLFLALHTGCAIMFIHDSLRFNTNFFSNFESTGVTYMQITPTLFQQFGIENIQKRILNANSSLKFLVLGGEAFPMSREILNWQDWESENKKRIFNIYGVTEMSCWSSIYEVRKDDLSDDKIPLGKELDETNYGYYSPPSSDYDPNDCVEQLILLSKSRVCYINHNKNKLKNEASFNGFYACYTGDLVRKLNGKLYWHGRTNDVVKRYGEKIDTNVIERVASDFNARVSCVFVKKKIVLFYQSNDATTHQYNDENFKEKFYNHLKLKLNANEIPDDIRRIAFLPMNEHGKVSKEKLRELYKEISSKDYFTNDVEEFFIDAVNQMFNLKLYKPSSEENGKNGDEPDGKRRRGDFDATFNQIGGKSFDALRVVMKIEDKLGVNSTGLLPKLLDDKHSLKDICSFLKEIKTVQFKSDVAVTTKLKLIKQFQAYNLEKCVDSSPGLLKINDTHVISIGSHSHKLININAKTLEIISHIELGDRIECEVAQFKDCGLVGCYDGLLYCFDAIKGKNVWKYESGGMIKSKPLVLSDELIIFGNYNYDKNIQCIKVNENNEIELKWSKMLGRLGIYANILQINKDSVIVATLGSTIHKVKIEDGQELWKTKQLESPIFSSPVIIPGRDEFLVAEVTKNIHCFDFEGKILWNFKDFEGQLFSSFTFTSDFNDSSEKEIKIIFGSHDKFLRCLKYCPHQKLSKIDLEWKVELQSQIYSTPKMIKAKDKDYVISCSTNGYINFICLKNGIIEYAKKLPGDIFSSPLIYNNDSLFIGCRDNFLYGFLL